MSTYLITIGLVLLILLAGILVDQLYKAFARRHPELGPFRGEGGGCGGGCGACGGGSCSSKHE